VQDLIPPTALPVTAALFLIAAIVVWFSGSRLVVYADEVADRMRIGRALMGFVFLAAATSMPEIVTTGMASATGESSLALGNLLGGITLQFAILAVADGFARGAAITSYPRKTTAVVEGVALAFLLALLFGILVLGETSVLGHIGIGATMLGIFYIATIFLLRGHDEDDPWMPVSVPEPGETERESMFISSFPELGTAVLNARFAMLCVVILAAGALTVTMAERIAFQTGLGTGLVGVTLLAGVTSLPELSTTIAAVRLGAYTMAISNIFGSNLLMLALVWPADALFRHGPILAEFEPVLYLALVSGLLATIIYVAGLIVRSRRNVLGFGLDSLAVLGVFAVTLAFYWLRG
jgi:cation:H+ antiporter